MNTTENVMQCATAVGLHAVVRRREVSILIGPCPCCGQHAITLYADGMCACEGVTKRAVFERPKERWDRSPGLGQPGALLGIAEQKCGYQASAKQCAYDIKSPHNPYAKPLNEKLTHGGENTKDNQ